MALNLDVGSGGGIFQSAPQAEICVDIDLPKTHLDYFVRCDADHLPFRDRQFDTVYAFNLLEHVRHPQKTIKELRRVGNSLKIRQDKILCLASYATPEHYQFQLPRLIFIPYPRTRIGIQFSKNLRQMLTGRSRTELLFQWLLRPIISRHYYLELK